MQNQQVKQLIDMQGVKIFNAGTSVSKGAEFSLKAIASPVASFTLSYGYTLATFSNYTYSSETDYTGNYLPFVPRHTLSAGADFFIPFRSVISDRLLLHTAYTGMGEIYWHENNLVKQPFYGLLNASAGVEKGKLNLTLWAKNILNSRYLGYYFEASGRQLGKPGKPFTAGVSLGYSL